MDFDAAICIVGAGMSGILAAEKLHSLGYRNIDIIEAKAQLGGYSETFKIDGKVYDFQAHLIVQQNLGKDIAGTALQDLLDKYPMETHTESLYFVSKSRSGKIERTIPPNFVPLLKSLTPEQVVDQLVQTWNIIEGAIENKTGPGQNGLAFDRLPGETWESFRARHAPLVGEILQSITIYANMRRVGQPVESVINANAYISGHISHLAKAILFFYLKHKDLLLARMPASLITQLSSARPMTLSFPSGFNSFLQKIVRDCGLKVLVNTQVVEIEALHSESIKVTFVQGADNHREKLSKTYARVLVTTPVYLSAAAVRNGWYDRLEAVQGRNGIYFLGEIISGPTIECISSLIEDVIPK